MHRRPLRAGLALIASLAIASLAWNPVMGGNTRIVTFGSPGSDGQLVTTLVTTGNKTAVDVKLVNPSTATSTLTHVLIQGGDGLNPLANPSFPAPAPICQPDGTCFQSLPADMSYVASYVDPASTVNVSCPQPQPARTLDCAVANMKPGDVAQIRIALTQTSVGTSELFWLQASLKEGTSSTGSNQDTFFAYGNAAVQPAGCGATDGTNGNANFFLATEGVELSNGSSCDQATDISGRDSKHNLLTFPTEGAFASISETDANDSWCSNLGLTTCFGHNSLGNVNNGVQPKGTYVEWNITWSSTLLTSGKPSGVVHFPDGYNPLTNLPAPEVILFKAKDQCSGSVPAPCWVSTSSTKTSFEAIFRTPNNGTSHGF